MSIKKCFLLMCAMLLSAYSCILSQNADTLKNHNSLEQEILAQEDAEREIISKSRKLIALSLRSGNFEKIRQILEYLEYKFDGSEYLPLEKKEKIFLSYCAQDYRYVLKNYISKEPYNDIYASDNIILPQEDLLEKNLESYLQNKYLAIRNEIDSSKFSGEEKSFLKLYLTYILFDGERTPFLTLQQINIESDAFLSKYPKSYFVEFIREEIRFVLKTSDWGFGLGIFGGGGFYNGGLNSFFQDYASFGFDLEGSYQRWLLQFNFNLGRGNVEDQFEYKGNWNNEVDLDYKIISAYLGYFIIDNKRLNLTPFLGIGIIDILPTEEARKDAGNNVAMGYSAIYSLGLQIDLKYESDSYYYYGSTWMHGDTPSNHFRFKIGYNFPTFFQDDGRFTGGIFFFQIGWGFLTRGQYRDY